MEVEEDTVRASGFLVQRSGEVHSLAGIVSVVPVPAAEAAVIYKGVVPVASFRFLYHPFAKEVVVIFPVSKLTATAPGLEVKVLLERW